MNRTRNGRRTLPGGGGRPHLKASEPARKERWIMKKKASLIALCALSLTAAFALAGCGASLDREIAVQGMTM